VTNTPKFGMYLPTDSDPMNDVDLSFNNSWSTIAGIPAPNTYAFLPVTDFSYNVGDVIYHSTTNSIYVLIAQDSIWGNFWRPVEAKYGPWIQPSSNIIADAATYKFGSTPVQYRLTNAGSIIWRGSVDTVSASGWANWETTGTAHHPLIPVPLDIAPSHTSVYSGAVYPFPASSSKPYMSQMGMFADGHWTFLVWNPGTATGAFLQGWQWQIGYGNGYGPSN
jgi:hypothetical protein